MSRRPLVVGAHPVERARAFTAGTGVRSAFEAIRPSESVHADGMPEVGIDG